MVTDCPVLTAPCSFAHPEGAQCPQFKTSLIFSIQFSGNKTLQNSSGWWLIYCYIIYRYIYIWLIYMVIIWLMMVIWWCNVPILKNDGVNVNGKDDKPYMKWNIKHV
jgi:hypothetical protein